jgi:hypothetical protein
VRGRQLRDVEVRGPRRGHVLQREIFVDRGVVDLRHLVGKPAQQRVHLRGEGDAVLQPAIEQRLLSGAIAGEQKAVAARVEQRKGKHSVQAPHALEPVFLVQMEDHLAIAPRAKRVSPGQQLRSEFPEVVDLAVRDQRDAAVLVAHRLIGLGTEIDDRQAAMAERARAVAPETFGIGAAVADRVGHAPNGLEIGGGAAIVRKKSADSAHGLAFGEAASVPSRKPARQDGAGCQPRQRARLE